MIISTFIQYLFDKYDTITTINAIMFLFVLLYIWISKADDWVDDDKENRRGSLLDHFSQCVRKTKETIISFRYLVNSDSKRKKHNIQYLTIDYNLGMPSTLIFEGKKIQK